MATLPFGALWALFAVLVVLVAGSTHRHHLADAAAAGLLELVAGGVLLVLLSRRPHGRAEPEAGAGADEPMRSIELVTDPTWALLPPDQALEEMMDRLRRALDVDLTSIFILGEDGTLALRTFMGPPDLDPAGADVPRGAGIIGRVAASGEPAVVNPVRRGDLPASLEGRLQAMVAAPLTVDGRLVGVIACGWSNPPAIGDSDLRVVRLVAERVAATMERTRLDDAQRRAGLSAEGARSQLGLLSRAGDILARALDEYESSLQALGPVVVPDYADWFTIHLGRDGRGGGRIRRTWMAGTASRRPTAGRRRDAGWDELVARIMAEGRPGLLYLGPDGTPVGDHAESGVLAANGFQSVMFAPLQVQGLSFGVLGFAREEARRGFRSSDLPTAAAVGERVATTIERVLLYREAQEAAQAATGRASQLRRLMEATLTVNRPLSEPQLLTLVTEQARRVMGAERATASARDGAGQVLRASSPAGPDSVQIGAVEELVARTGRSARGGPGATRSDAPDSPDDGGLLSPGPNVAWLAAPLNDAEGSQLGSIVLVGSGDREFTVEDESILVSIAQMASVTLGNAALYDTVRANSRRLETLMESSPLGIVELDLSGRAEWWNPTAAELFGWERTPGPGHTLADLETTPSGELSRLWYRAVRGQAMVGLEASVDRGPDQRARQLSVSTAPIRKEDDTVSGVMAILDDITDRRVLEDQFHQAERLEAMGRLAGGVAHDFNNLITVILGYCDLLLRRAGPDDPMTEEVQAIARAGQLAAALTSQLLAVGRREIGNPQVIEPGAVLREIEPMVRSMAGADIRVDVRAALDGESILIDPAQLERMILNLTINSHDAMPDGGELVIDARTIDLDIDQLPSGTAPGRFVQIAITDTGQGMSAETLEHCFEPFFTTKDKSKGTGLGLAAVHGVAAGAGGHVFADSRVGRGTTLTIRLPVIEDTAYPRAAGDGHPDERVRAVRPALPIPGTILLVDDQAELRALAAVHLEALGYTVRSAANGEEALEVGAAMNGQLDLLVTDVIMPGISGVELARQLEREQPNLAVLFISAYAGGDKLGPGRLPRGADLLAKPFTPDELAHRVRQALEQSQVPQGSNR